MHCAGSALWPGRYCPCQEIKKMTKQKLSFDEYDEMINPRPTMCDFDRVVEAGLSRRGFLSGLLAFGSGAMAMGTTMLTGSPASAAARFGFTPIPIDTSNTVTVPQGYSWQVVAKWGQPMFSGVQDVRADFRGTGATQAMAFGDNTDGMDVFTIGDRQVMAVNNEYIEEHVLLAGNPDDMPQSVDDAMKVKAAHGVSIAEIIEADGVWSIVVDSPFNRRIHMDTPIDISGPAKGHDLLKTLADATGSKALGTWNNCGNGRTPWGTYLTCEENFNGYFGSTRSDLELTADFKRYGIALESRYNLELFDPRFDLSQNPNEPYRHGYVVEIDPTDPDSTPVKRTALGRFKHENAELVIANDGRVVVYLGDDERGEFIYKFVSDAVYAEGGDTSTLLDNGTLYAAKFNEDGTGTWLALTPETTGMASQAEISVLTRAAGSAVGATTMDRPEWIAVNPNKAEVYCCLTNNSRRGPDATNAGGDAMQAGGPNPRDANKYGQIVRLRPTSADHTETGFDWDLYVMAGNPVVGEGAYKGSNNVNAGNMFNSPDGMRFDSRGMLWIQTDGDDSNEGEFAGMGNNQMLMGDPATGEIVRFLTGPSGSEVTGLTWSADRRTAFVGIQHPGGTFPDGIEGMPRSAIIAVKRDDNGIIG